MIGYIALCHLKNHDAFIFFLNYYKISVITKCQLDLNSQILLY